MSNLNLTKKSNKLTVAESKSFTQPNYSLKNVFREKDYFDKIQFDTIFQRNIVWIKSQKEELIISILTGRLIPFIQLNENNAQDWLIVDGKQRLDAIRAFFENEFSIHWYDPDNNKDEKYFWKDLVKADKGSYESKLRETLLSYTLPINMWHFSDFAKVEQLFAIYNNGTSLSQWEKVYCENYLARAVLSFIIDENPALTKILNKNHLKTKRFSAHSFLHKILLSMFGLDFKSHEYDIGQELNQSIVEKSAANISSSIRNYFTINNKNLQSLKENELINSDVISYLGIDCSMKSFKDIIRCFNWLLETKSIRQNNIDALDFMHIGSFLREKLRLNEVSMSIIENDKQKLSKFYDNYIEWKVKGKEDMSRRSGSKRNIIRKKLESLWTFATPAQSNHISKSAKQLAIAKSNGKDPLNGDTITIDNLQFDHICPSSRYETSSVVAMSDTSNRKKSNLDIKDAQNLNNFFVQNESHLNHTSAYSLGY